MSASAGLYLTGTGSGTVTNQSSGTISGYDGILELTGTATVVNAGTIMSGGAVSSNGIDLGAGGRITNQSGGVISGPSGIASGGPTTIVNAGIIAGSTEGPGIYLFSTSLITNESGGVISGNTAIEALFGALTVVNAGTIIGTSDAVKFVSGVANRLVIDPNAVFTGTVTGGNAIGASHVSTLELASAGSVGTLSGLGTQFIDFGQVTVDAGAQWTLQASDTIEAGVTLANAGTLDGSVTLAAGGVLSNASTGTITASAGAAVYGETGGAATVVNAGVIAGGNENGEGIYLSAGGTVTNQSGGSISSYYGIEGRGGPVTVVNAGSITGSGQGIMLFAGGSVTNQSGGVIIGVGPAIFAQNSAATVVNAGTIGYTEGLSGVNLSAGGTVTNQSGGVIIGGDGVFGHGGVTVVNAGTIIGAVDAVQFGSSYANRLVIDPDAVFSGIVDGGNTIGATQVSTLELASAASPGTLSGLGTQFVHFGQVTVDAGAQWTLQASDTIESGVTMTNAGTLSGRGDAGGGRGSLERFDRNGHRAERDGRPWGGRRRGDGGQRRADRRLRHHVQRNRCWPAAAASPTKAAARSAGGTGFPP